MADRLAATAAARTLRAFFSVWTWENCAFPGRFKPDALYLEKAAEAHVLILLIDDRLSVNTKREYDASVRNRRSQMILFREGAKLDPSARDFKRKLRGATYWQYGNEDELRTIIYRGLRMNMLRYAKIGMKASIGTRVEYSELGV
ncbi:MAG: hypothetical protein JWO31_2606 [Phycisphaerales bacterium]|nr:hypothetical protein [Phycisphaerales bacterium]